MQVWIDMPGEYPGRGQGHMAEYDNRQIQQTGRGAGMTEGTMQSEEIKKMVQACIYVDYGMDKLMDAICDLLDSSVMLAGITDGFSKIADEMEEYEKKLDEVYKRAEKLKEEMYLEYGLYDEIEEDDGGEDDD